VKAKRVAFAGLTVVVPDEWLDITDDLSPGSPPTLARVDGVGALQFSIAFYRTGNRPNIEVASLMALLNDFARTRKLGNALNVRSWSNSRRFVVGDFRTESEVIRVWYASNGDDVALVTYVAAECASLAIELEAVDAIVGSIEFPARSA
jgi:hypothetical protein